MSLWQLTTVSGEYLRAKQESAGQRQQLPTSAVTEVSRLPARPGCVCGAAVDGRAAPQPIAISFVQHGAPISPPSDQTQILRVAVADSLAKPGF